MCESTGDCKRLWTFASGRRSCPGGRVVNGTAREKREAGSHTNCHLSSNNTTFEMHLRSSEFADKRLFHYSVSVYCMTAGELLIQFWVVICNVRSYTLEPIQVSSYQLVLRISWTLLWGIKTVDLKYQLNKNVFKEVTRWTLMKATRVTIAELY